MVPKIFEIVEFPLDFNIANSGWEFYLATPHRLLKEPDKQRNDRLHEEIQKDTNW